MDYIECLLSYLFSWAVSVIDVHLACRVRWSIMNMDAIICVIVGPSIHVG